MKPDQAGHGDRAGGAAGRATRQGGQALIMVTLALLMMFGMIGLAVDLGYQYFVRRSTQAAADAAALAAVKAGLDMVGQAGVFSCGHVACQSGPAPCSSSFTGTNLGSGCMYAGLNGYQSGGRNGRQSLSVEAQITPTFSTGTGPVKVHYWATYRATDTYAQLFSAALGNTTSTAGAFATAAVVDVVVDATLILMNREWDYVQEFRSDPGLNLHAEGGTRVTVDGTILMHSAHQEAGWVDGGGLVDATMTQIRGTGDIREFSDGTWDDPVVNSLPDGQLFGDPMRGKGQPPAPRGLPLRPVSKDTGLMGGTYPPGNYYEAELKDGVWIPTGKPIIVRGNAIFDDGSGFGNYVFFGGVKIDGGTETTVTMAPGQYIFAGVEGTLPVLDVSSHTTLQDKTSGYGPNADAGEILIFTDTGYPGLEVPPLLDSVKSKWQTGTFRTQGGNINLHGLNADSPALPVALEPFAPVVFWQDQRNSRIKYTADGYIDNSCGNADPLAGCSNPLTWENSPGMNIETGANFNLYGTIYQPRGAWLSIQSQSTGQSLGQLQIMTGSLNIESGSSLSLQRPVRPARRRQVALIN